MFHASTKILKPDRIQRYQVFAEETELTFADAIELWQASQEFCEFFTSLLGESSFAAFRWETPSLTSESACRTFEFVLINSPEFIRRRCDRRAYSEYFGEDDNSVVSFPNISGDAMLIVPTPQSEETNYGHLAAFVRGAPAEQVRSLWGMVGQKVAQSISNAPIWLSTAGGGVAWLHVRIDSRPKYYAFTEYKRP